MKKLKFLDQNSLLFCATKVFSLTTKGAGAALLMATLFSIASLWPEPSQANDTQVTKIENADLVCKSNADSDLKDAMFAVDTENERVWQAAPGESEGNELTVDHFEVSTMPNCVGCILITARLKLLGESAYYQIETNRNSDGLTLMAVLIGSSPKQWSKTIMLDCEPKRRTAN